MYLYELLIENFDSMARWKSAIDTACVACSICVTRMEVVDSIPTRD